MEIKTIQEQGSMPVTRFAVSGSLNSDEPLLTMARGAYAQGARKMLIDLSDVPYMSSAGLRALHGIYVLLRDQSETSEAVNQGLRDGSYHSPHLKVLNPSRNVLEVFKMAGYDMFIETHTDLQKALASF